MEVFPPIGKPSLSSSCPQMYPSRGPLPAFPHVSPWLWVGFQTLPPLAHVCPRPPCTNRAASWWPSTPAALPHDIGGDSVLHEYRRRQNRGREWGQRVSARRPASSTEPVQLRQRRERGNALERDTSLDSAVARAQAGVAQQFPRERMCRSPLPVGGRPERRPQGPATHMPPTAVKRVSQEPGLPRWRPAASQGAAQTWIPAPADTGQERSLCRSRGDRPSGPGRPAAF